MDSSNGIWMLMALTDVALCLPVLGVTSLCIALSRRVWAGVAVFAAATGATAFWHFDPVFLSLAVLPSVLMLAAFWLTGRESETGLLKPEARSTAIITTIVGLVPLVVVCLVFAGA